MAAVLDLRRGSSFAAAHLRSAVHIDGLAALAQRFSSLPPAHGHREGGGQAQPGSAGEPHLALVVAHAADESGAREALERWQVPHWCVLPDSDERGAAAAVPHAAASKDMPGTQDCSPPAQAIMTLCREHLPQPDGGPDALAAASTAFWAAAGAAGLLVPCAAEVPPRLARAPDDVPPLLHQPSPLVRRALAAWHAQRRSGASDDDAEPQRATALDLGCGGGRDLAWICELGREQEQLWQAALPAVAAEDSRSRQAHTSASPNGHRPRPPMWRCTGVDNLRPALVRASLLLADAGYPPLQPLPTDTHAPPRPSSAALSHGVDSLLWAQCSPDGALNALAAPPGCSSRVARLGTATAARPLDGHAFDLVLLVRFLPRALLPSLDALVAPGGILAISHFAAIAAEDEASLPHEYDSPPPAGRFARAEVGHLVQLWNSRGTQRWRVLEHTIDRAEDGRPLRSVLLWRQQ